MKFRAIVFTLILAVATAGFSADITSVAQSMTHFQIKAAQQSVRQDIQQSHVKGAAVFNTVSTNDDTLFFETFDNGASGWTSVDRTDVGEKWYLDSWNAYGSSGESWRVADPDLGTNGGYESHWYQVIDTDEMTLTASAELTFYFRLKVEAPGEEPAGYDGWDGVNVRISTDGGSTWEVLTPQTPAYTASSLFSFGDEFGEGTGVPGWNGTISSWTQATFDLSAYSGESASIRFAFCSDPSYDTNDDASLFGWQIDDIQVADGGTVIFSNDGVASSMTPGNGSPIGGDYWHISDDANAPSPTKVANANDESTGSYHPNMLDEYISPYFALPADAQEVLMDFSVKGSFADDDTELPDVDYWGARVQVKGETSWRYISNITQDPDGDNYVYTDAPTEWYTFSDSYESGAKVDLTPLVGLGDSLRIRFSFNSDEDTPQGAAIQLDNVIVYSPGITRLAPTGLEAVAGDGQVDLTWDDMNESSEQTFFYGDGTMESFIAGQAWQVPVVGAGWAVQYETDIETQLTSIKYMLSSGNTSLPGQLAEIKMVIWDETGTKIFESDPFTPTAMDELLTYDLSGENILIDGMFYAGWVFTTTDYPYIALDTSSPSVGKAYAFHPGTGGGLISLSGSGLDGNYAILVTGITSGSGVTYNLYRRESSVQDYPDTPIASDLADASYSDTDVTNGTEYYYAVTAVYSDGGEGPLSEEVLAMPQAESVYEMSYDDGSAETGYSIGENNQFAVRITPESYPVQVMKAKIYMNDAGGKAVLTLWDDDGENGMPGTVLVNTLLRNLTEGWNEKDISAADITITDGDFYIGIIERSDTPPSGIDQSVDNDRSYYFVDGGGSWGALGDIGFSGNLMYRTLLDSSVIVATNPELSNVPTKMALAQNYPNPFNPQTSIAFDLPAKGHVSLTVYDINGRLVRKLVNSELSAGHHSAVFNGANIASGLYLYVLETSAGTAMKKMMLLK